MPQTLQKISPEYAKSYYGIVINPTLPFSVEEEQERRISVKVIASGGNVPPLRNPSEVDDQPIVEQNG